VHAAHVPACRDRARSEVDPATQPRAEHLNGEVTLASGRKVVKVDKGSAMLLRVNGAIFTSFRYQLP